MPLRGRRLRLAAVFWREASNEYFRTPGKGSLRPGGGNGDLFAWVYYGAAALLIARGIPGAVPDPNERGVRLASAAWWANLGVTLLASESVWRIRARYRRGLAVLPLEDGELDGASLLAAALHPATAILVGLAGALLQVGAGAPQVGVGLAGSLGSSGVLATWAGTRLAGRSAPSTAARVGAVGAALLCVGCALAMLSGAAPPWPSAPGALASPLAAATASPLLLAASLVVPAALGAALLARRDHRGQTSPPAGGARVPSRLGASLLRPRALPLVRRALLRWLRTPSLWGASVGLPIVVTLGVAGALLLRGEHAVVGDTLLLRVALVGAAAGVTACAAQEAGTLRDARAWSLPRPPTTQLRAAAAVYIAIGQVLLTAFLMGLGLTLTETASTALGALLVLSAAGALAALAGAVASATRFQKLPIAAAFAAVPLLAAADPGPRAFTAAAMVLGVETILWRWKWL